MKLIVTVTPNSVTTSVELDFTLAAPTLGVGELPTATPVSDNAASYHNTTVGFKLDYPADWRLINASPEAAQTSNIYSVSLISWPTSQGTEGVPRGGTRIEIVVVKSGVTSLDEAVAARKLEVAQSGATLQKVFAEETWTLASDLAAQRWLMVSQFGSDAEFLFTSELITAINGHTVILRGWGDPTRFDAVARSLGPE